MTKLRIDFDFHLIQQIRLVHALTESKYSIYLPPTEISKFSVLQEKFAVSFADTHDNSVDISNYLNISHVAPITSVGGIVRPLIFPHAISTYCRTLWSGNREHRFSFQGLVTDKRRLLLGDWIEKNLNKSVTFSNPNSIYRKIQRKLASHFGLGFTKKRKISELLLWESDRGRRFPIKAWDDEYFKVLANSEFVLCPSGDCIWSYRFFESILCGAMPIVEASCEAYEGFRFLSLDDDVSKLKWSKTDAEHNFKTCAERITIPSSLLNSEINDILVSLGQPTL